jgi:choline oxidase
VTVQAAREADFVIVGGGTAGAIIAARLAEDNDISVILLEAGPPDEGNRMILELRYSADLLGTGLDYDYAIEQQLAGNSRIRQSRGRMLGGCSSHNTGVAWIAPEYDLLEWERRGGTGWGPEGARPFFDRLLARVHVERAPTDNACARALVAAAQEAGHPLADFDGGICREGVGWFALNVEDGIRQSSSVCYLHPLDRLPENLTVLTSCTAGRILIDGSGAAVAVATSHGRIVARREVVVCCGAFDTPKLLLLSGVGPRDHLRQVGIETVHELPAVGEHLVDHPDAVLLYSAAQPMPPLAMTGWEAGVFVRSRPDLTEPDVMFHLGTLPYDLNTAPAGYPTTANGFSINPNVMRPASEGVVRLRSAEATDPPSIDPRYYTDEAGRDLDLMAWALEAGRTIAAQPALEPWLDRELAPGDCTSDLKRFACETGGTVFHPAGSCRMGAAADSDAVVGPDLRVRGLERLRIADASVFPTLTGVNPAVTVMMVGEKCAALLKEEAAR